MSTTSEDKIFKAIADQKRRKILQLLTTSSSEMNINDISNYFDESRQGITKHIKILEKSGLVTIRKKGRDRYCKSNPEILEYVQKWVNYYEKFWKGNLDDPEDFLNR